MDLGGCPCSDIGLSAGNMNASMSFFSFMKHGYFSRYMMALQQRNITTRSSRKSPEIQTDQRPELLVRKCDATMRQKKSPTLMSACPSLICVAPFLYESCRTVCTPACIPICLQLQTSLTRAMRTSIPKRTKEHYSQGVVLLMEHSCTNEQLKI